MLFRPLTYNWWLWAHFIDDLNPRCKWPKINGVKPGFFHPEISGEFSTRFTAGDFGPTLSHMAQTSPGRRGREAMDLLQEMKLKEVACPCCKTKSSPSKCQESIQVYIGLGKFAQMMLGCCSEWVQHNWSSTCLLLQVNGWKINFLLGWPIFKGKLLVSGSVTGNNAIILGIKSIKGTLEKTNMEPEK